MMVFMYNKVHFENIFVFYVTYVYYAYATHFKRGIPKISILTIRKRHHGNATDWEEFACINEKNISKNLVFWV